MKNNSFFKSSVITIERKSEEGTSIEYLNPLEYREVTSDNIDEELKNLFLTENNFNKELCTKKIVNWCSEKTEPLLVKKLHALKEKEEKKVSAEKILERINSVLIELSYYPSTFSLLSAYDRKNNFDDSKLLAENIYKQHFINGEKNSSASNNYLSEIICNLMLIRIKNWENNRIKKQENNKKRKENLDISLFKKDSLFSRVSARYFSDLLEKNRKEIFKIIKKNIEAVGEKKLDLKEESFKSFATKVLKDFFKIDLHSELRKHLQDVRKKLKENFFNFKTTRIDILVGSLLFYRGIIPFLVKLYHPNENSLKHSIVVNLTDFFKMLSDGSTMFEEKEGADQRHKMLSDVCRVMQEEYKAFLNRQYRLPQDSSHSPVSTETQKVLVQC